MIARIEGMRANAAAALHKAGVTADDMRFQQTMAAVDALLRVHGAALNHAAATAPLDIDPGGAGPGQSPQGAPPPQPTPMPPQPSAGTP